MSPPLPGVMLVDDTAAERRLLRLLLEGSGRFRVIAEAGDGEEAVQRAPEVVPDLILLDLSMPRMDGLEALPLLKRAVPSAVVVVFSGFSATQQADAVIRLGAHSYLEKGLHPEEIVAHLASAVARPAPAAVRSSAVGSRAPTTVRAARSARISVERGVLGAEVVAVLHEGVVVQDAGGMIVSCNPSAERMLRLRREEATGHVTQEPGVRAIDVHGEPLPGDRHPAMVALTTGEPQFDVTIGIGPPDGDRRWLLVSATPLRSEDETLPHGVVTSYLDITDRRVAEDRFHSLLEFAPDGIVVAGPEGRIQIVNAATEQLFGYAREELLGQPVEILLPEERAEPHVTHRRAFMEHPRSRPMGGGRPLEGRRKDGSTVPVEVSLSAVATATGPMVYAAIRDATDRTAAAATAERLSAIVGSAQDAIIAIGSNGAITQWNPAAARMYGWGADEIMGQHVSLLLPPTRIDEPDVQITSWLTAEEPMTVDAECVRKDGTPWLASLTLAPLRDAGRAVVGVSAIVRDVTDARQADAMLRESEERWRLTQQLAPIGLAIVGLDGRWLHVNPALCRIVGHPPEDLLGLRFQDITHPDDLDIDLHHARQLLNGERDRYTLQKRYVHAEGHIAPVEVHVALVRAADGTPRNFVAQVVDLADRASPPGRGNPGSA